MCLPGTYGMTYGLTSPGCSGMCQPGYYCPQGSVTPTEVKCGDPSLYCPTTGLSRPLPVPLGYYSLGGNESTRNNIALAPPGYYALQGILYVCPAGYYGSNPGMFSLTCSGPCRVPGFYCPAGSTVPTMLACGGDDRYCPGGAISAAPVPVVPGFYTADYMSVYPMLQNVQSVRSFLSSLSSEYPMYTPPSTWAGWGGGPILISQVLI